MVLPLSVLLTRHCPRLETEWNDVAIDWLPGIATMSLLVSRVSTADCSKVARGHLIRYFTRKTNDQDNCADAGCLMEVTSPQDIRRNPSIRVFPQASCSLRANL